MGAQSGIEWTDSSWSPIRSRQWNGPSRIGWHCEHVSEGCRNCYAEGINRRLGTGLDFKPGHRSDIEIFLDEDMLLAPLRWKKPRRIFVNSMTDLFADFVKDEWIDRMFAVMALAQQHRFQVLTKRAKRMREYITSRTDYRYSPVYIHQRSLDDSASCWTWPLPNVWLGVSAEDQANWDARKEDLRNTPAAVHFASFEPLLGAIVERWPMSDFIQWAIVGGESGPHARPMHPEWARSLRNQCAATRVPFFFKQWGAWAPKDSINVARPHALCGLMGNGPFIERDWLKAHDFLQKIKDVSGCGLLERVGKRGGGRLLDGELHNGMPA